MLRAMCLAASVFSALSICSTESHADSPREFLIQAQQGANSEIMLARLATKYARNPAVRDFGQTLVDDHRQARDDIRSLGRRFGVPSARDISPEARDELDRLTDLRGRRFDREFINYMIEDHRKDIAEFRDEAREQHGPVSEFARRQLPTLRKHLDIASALGNQNGRFSGNFDQTGTRDTNDWRNRDPNSSGASRDFGTNDWSNSDRHDGDYRRDRDSAYTPQSQR